MDNLIWKFIPDKEYVKIYGPDSLKEKSEPEVLKKRLDTFKLQTKRICCKKNSDNEQPDKKRRKMENVYTVDEVEDIDQTLFKTLEKEKKARFNWRKVMTMIQLVKALSSGDNFEK